MLCPKCGTEMRIGSTVQQVTGDSSTETPTVVKTVQTLVCRNPQCMNFEKVVANAETEIYRSDGQK